MSLYLAPNLAAPASFQHTDQVLFSPYGHANCFSVPGLEKAVSMTVKIFLQRFSFNIKLYIFGQDIRLEMGYRSGL